MSKKILIPVTLILLIISCKSDIDKADLSGIPVDLEIKRFEQDLFSIDPANISYYIPDLKLRYENFFQIFNHRIISIGSDEQALYPEYLKEFITDFINFRIFQRTQEVFPDLAIKKGDGTLGVRYSGLIPVLVQVLKEQQAEIEALTKRISDLEMANK